MICICGCSRDDHKLNTGYWNHDGCKHFQVDPIAHYVVVKIVETDKPPERIRIAKLVHKHTSNTAPENDE